MPVQTRRQCQWKMLKTMLASMGYGPYFSCMKMTMNIDDDLLSKVMTITGTDSKTAAVDLALREVARKSDLKDLAMAGLGLNAMELKETFDSSYDLAEMRTKEKPVRYGRKPSSGR